MTKTTKIIYWIATIWLCLGMLSGGIMQLIKHPDTVKGITHLGYPEYLVVLLGIWKILGVIVLLIPRFPLVKEWAYAGFFFAMSGATISHIIYGDPIAQILPSSIALVLIIVSWYCRPASRKISR